MEMCPYSLQLSAYHDGELSDEQRRRVEQHLESACPACQAELQQWQRFSQMLASAPAVRLPAEAREALYRLAPAAREIGVIRLAEWATALAASVLIAVSGWLVLGHKTTAAQPVAEAQPWVKIALNPPKSLDTVADAGTDTQLPDWVLSNLEQ